MDKFIALLEAILASSIFWGVVALMALALALSGKLSVSAAITVLWLAWATAVFGIYRAEIVAKLDPVIKYLGLVMVASGLAIGAVMIGRWLEKPQEKPQETTASKLTTPTSDTGKQPITLPPAVLTPEQRKARADQRELERRRDLLDRLRNEYIASHDNISPALLAGTEQPPSDWINKRLTELGEKWTVTTAKRLQAANLRITEHKEIAGVYQARYAVQVTIETDKTIQPVHLRIQCDGPLTGVDLREPQRLQQYSYGIVPGEPDVAEVTFVFPPMDRGRPVVLALLANQKVKAIAVRNVQ